MIFLESRAAPSANFLLSPQSTQIIVLSVWICAVQGLWRYRAFVFGEKFADQQRRVRRCIVMVKHPFFPSMNQAFFS
jgi:hypothetical protein